MARSTWWLLSICLLSISGVIILQFFWIKNYYATSVFNFEREVNLAFEDAIKKDFELRCDTIESILVTELMDTTKFEIKSKFLPAAGTVSHIVQSISNRKDQTSFSHVDLPALMQANDTAYKLKIARHYAHYLRTEDLDIHVVFYRLQSLGSFALDNVITHGFDTSGLRVIFNRVLQQRNIKVPFYFKLSANDSLLNFSTNKNTNSKSQIITKAYPTYKWWDNHNKFVRAAFYSPINYVLVSMKWILAGSLLLIILVAFCIFTLLKAVFREKKLAAIKNDFINNITHELKTPIATISAALEAVKDFDLNKEKQARYLSHAKNETDRLNKIIENILTVSLFNNKSLRINYETTDIKQTIDTIIDNFRIAGKKEIYYTFKNNSGIEFIFADNALFQQAFINIIDNAIKYSDDTVEINISCTKTDGYLCIKCIDNGQGISPAALPFVFEKFYREPKPNHAVKGFGLGLNYVQEILKAHNGKIEIQSTVKKGTAISLYWPV